MKVWVVTKTSYGMYEGERDATYIVGIYFSEEKARRTADFYLYDGHYDVEEMEVQQ